MSDITLSFTCRNKECGETLEMDVTDVERGYEARITNDPFHSHPAEGPCWTWGDDVTCECGAVHDEAWMELELRGVVMDLIETPDDDGPEYDPMDEQDRSERW